MVRVKKTKSAKVKKNSAITPTKLRKLNFIAAGLHALQGILVLVLSDPEKGLRPITANYLSEDKISSEVVGQPVLASATHYLFDLNLAYVVAAFFFVCALAHLAVATWKRKVYDSDLKKGINRARWVEYSFSASIMMVGIGLLVGVFDFTSLLMIFGLTLIMSLLGLNMELRNQANKNVDWANYWIGGLAAFIPWLVLVLYIWNAYTYGNGVPGFVYWICGSLLVLYASFAANMYLQYKKVGHWSTYLYGERAYIILGLVAKTAVAWQIFAGTLR